MKLKQVEHDTTKYDKVIKRTFITISIILCIPLSFTSYKISKDTYQREQIISKLETFISSNEVLSDDKKVLFMTYSKSKNTLRLDCIGEDITDEEAAEIKEHMETIGIGDAELVVVNDLEQTIMDYIEFNSVSGTPKVNIID